MLKLGTATLSKLPAGVARPSYDRAQLRVGIVHFGTGGFHRAHAIGIGVFNMVGRKAGKLRSDRRAVQIA